MLVRLIAAAAAWFVVNGLLFLVRPPYPATAVSVVCAVLATPRSYTTPSIISTSGSAAPSTPRSSTVSARNAISWLVSFARRAAWICSTPPCILI